jgi:hypothetical protein
MSTIITDNPYTFTVEDNMNINAVFEDSGVEVKGIGGTGYITSGTASWRMSYNGTDWAHGTLSATSGPSNTYDVSFPRTAEIGGVFKFTRPSTSYGRYIRFHIYRGSTDLYGSRDGSWTVPAELAGKQISIIIEKS